MPMSIVPVARPGSTRQLDRALKHVVGKDYFATTGIPIHAGRTFRREEETRDSATVVVSAALASLYFPGEDPIGRRIVVAIQDLAPARTLPGSYDYRLAGTGSPVQSAVIVGVVGDVAEGLVVQKPVLLFTFRCARRITRSLVYRRRYYADPARGPRDRCPLPGAPRNRRARP